jgi:S-disulfanyl-L-cysteine oxidoreductase SoxD
VVIGKSLVIALVAIGVAVVYSVAWTPIQAQPLRSIWDGVYSDAQAQRGEQLYRQHCSRCHGADLAGVPWEAVGRAMPDNTRSYVHFDRTPEVTGPTFCANYDRLPLSDLVERIRISMPQNKPGMLTRKDVVDVVAYILSFGGVPLGRTELSDRLEALRKIQIVAYRP